MRSYCNGRGWRWLGGGGADIIKGGAGGKSGGGAAIVMGGAGGGLGGGAAMRGWRRRDGRGWR